MLTIGLFPNVKKSKAEDTVKWMIPYLQELGVAVLLNVDTAIAVGHEELGATWDELNSKLTLGITLGGDGTLLHVARKLAVAQIPLCGVNMGKLGFLTEVELENLQDALHKIKQGLYTVQDRLMLDAFVIRDNQETYVASALNDIVVTKNSISRMLRSKLFINDEFVANYSADGVVISTPTGSTGYSLSAGGPIISPDLRVLTITPICSHSIYSRPMIVSETENIKIEHSSQDAILMIDGQQSHNLLADDKVIIRSSGYSTKLVKLGERSYYETIRQKLWRGERDANV